MRVLIVSQWYSPEPDGRVSALAEALVARGHEVDVVTAFPHYPIGRLYDGYRIRWRQRERKNGVNILRLPIYVDHSRSPLRRSMNYVSFMASLLLLGPFLLRKPDAIWSYTVLVGFPSIWFKTLFRVPFMLEVADLWPDTLTETGMVRRGLMYNILAGMSRLAYERADAITVQNPGFKRTLAERGIDGNKIHVVENWADGDLYRPLAPDAALARELGIEGGFNVFFAGNIGLAQNLETVVDAAVLLKDHAGIRFVIVGDGSCHQQVMEYAHTQQANNVFFLGRRPAEQMAALFALSGALLVHLKDTPLFEITIPSKTQAYLACGKPIIMAAKGDGAALIQEAGCGVACQPENPARLAEAVLQVYHASEGERKKMGDAARQLFQGKYSKTVILDKMEKVLIDTAARRKRA